MAKEIVVWPQSQSLVEKEGFLENCELINSVKGIEVYGVSAYLVDSDWYKKFKNGELANVTYTDEDMDNLQVNYDEDWIEDEEED